MNGTNGFSEYKRLIEFRLEAAEANHKEVMDELKALGKRTGKIESRIQLFSAGYGALGAGVLLAVNFLIALMVGK